MTQKLDVDKVIEEGEIVKSMVAELGDVDKVCLSRVAYDALENLLAIAKQLRDENRELNHKLKNLLRDIVGGIS